MGCDDCDEWRDLFLCLQQRTVTVTMMIMTASRLKTAPTHAPTLNSAENRRIKTEQTILSFGFVSTAITLINRL